MKEVLLKDFIGIWDNAISDKFCGELVDLFEQCKKEKLVLNRQDSESIDESLKKDNALDLYSTYITYEGVLQGGEQFNITELKTYRNTILESIFNATREHYTKKWSLSPISSALSANAFKIQKTVKGEGYHIWHSEQSHDRLERTLVWTLYLTDIDEDCGGETQFLYYPHSCTPKKGRLMIFPAYFTHTHRGNVYWGHNPKYIATGWLNWDTPHYEPRNEK